MNIIKLQKLMNFMHSTDDKKLFIINGNIEMFYNEKKITHFQNYNNEFIVSFEDNTHVKFEELVNPVKVKTTITVE